LQGRTRRNALRGGEVAVLRADPLSKPEELIRRVYAYVAYRIGDGPDAEDVTSDVFERALRYRGSYEATKGDPVAWLIGIARRQLQSMMGARDPVADNADVSAAGDLEQEVVRRVDLHAAVAALDPRERELVAMRYGADLKARQIAEILGLRTNTVEVALHRALARLRLTLEDDDAGGRRMQARPAGVAPSEPSA
jgi:RNA polymerase sigma-70 factor (ECF subfamily)